MSESMWGKKRWEMCTIFRCSDYAKMYTLRDGATLQFVFRVMEVLRPLNLHGNAFIYKVFFRLVSLRFSSVFLRSFSGSSKRNCLTFPR